MREPDPSFKEFCSKCKFHSCKTPLQSHHTYKELHACTSGGGICIMWAIDINGKCAMITDEVGCPMTLEFLLWKQ